MKIAIVGLGGSYADYIAARVASQEFDEVWGINCIGGIIHVDKTFMMDPVSRFLDTDNAGTQTGVARQFLKTNKKPIVTCQLDKRVKHLELFPLKEVTLDLGYCYFNNTVPYAVAFAIYHKVTHLYLYGIDYSYNSNITIAEAGRACTEFWISAAVARGMQIEVAQDSTLLDTNVPEEEKLYGYHRLDDPLVMSVKDGALTVTKKSETTPPEPVDKPVLYGRHDKVVSLKEAVNV